VRTSFSFNCLTISVTQPSPKDSQASTSTPRWPSKTKGPFRLHRYPSRERYRCDNRRDPQNLRVSSTPSFSLVLAALARCERPSGASWRFWNLPARALCARSDREIRAHRPRQGSRHIHDNHPFRWRLSCGKGIPLEGCGRRSARQAEDPAPSAWPIASICLPFCSEG